MFLKFCFSPSFPISVGIALLGLTGMASACEGDCIVGITNAFLSNYSQPMNNAMGEMANRLVAQLIPHNTQPALSYFSPIMEEYNKRAYSYMENALFKTLFHGKCQNAVTGVEPPGCPNPDCPVICGTPGSLVHFYPTLKERAFNATSDNFAEIIANHNSPVFQKVAKNLLAAKVSKSGKRHAFRFKRSENTAQNESLMELLDERDDSGVNRLLANGLAGFRSAMVAACGEVPIGTENSIPDCNWNRSMKAYILSFP